MSGNQNAMLYYYTRSLEEVHGDCLLQKSYAGFPKFSAKIASLFLKSNFPQTFEQLS